MSENLSPAPPTATAAEDPRVTQALEEYLAALEAGHRPDREQFGALRPDIAAELGGCLEGLEFLHRAAAEMHADSGLPPAGGAGVPPAGQAGRLPHPAAPPLEDYEVLREVGRGGMGVVYEAVQRSLGRRVA